MTNDEKLIKLEKLVRQLLKQGIFYPSAIEEDCPSTIDFDDWEKEVKELLGIKEE